VRRQDSIPRWKREKNSFERNPRMLKPAASSAGPAASCGRAAPPRQTSVIVERGRGGNQQCASDLQQEKAPVRRLRVVLRSQRGQSFKRLKEQKDSGQHPSLIAGPRPFFRFLVN